MITLSLVRIAFDALRANKLRSFLTLLGVVVGVTSVMTIMSALEGLQKGIADTFNSIGSSTFVVTRMGIVTSEEMFWEKVRRKPLKLEHLELVKASCESCVRVAPRTGENVNVTANGKRVRDCSLEATTEEMGNIVDIDVSLGRYLSYEDNYHARAVAYIGQTVSERLFEGTDPLGKEIRINGVKYEVIGVAAKSGAVFDHDNDNTVVIPFERFRKQFGEPRRRLNFFVSAGSPETLDRAMDETRLLLRTARNVPYNKEDDFDLLTAAAAIEIISSLTAFMRSAMILISSIALVIGGIVVMNIMMVAVSERTREIGIRKSLGARRNHIMYQFLFETLMVTMTGGMIGVALGYIAAQSIVGLIGIQMSPSLISVALGLGMSTFTGLFFGIYPAMKAAKLDPIKALSYE